MANKRGEKRRKRRSNEAAAAIGVTSVGGSGGIIGHYHSNLFFDHDLLVYYDDKHNRYNDGH